MFSLDILKRAFGSDRIRIQTLVLTNTQDLYVGGEAMLRFIPGKQRSELQLPLTKPIKRIFFVLLTFTIELRVFITNPYCINKKFIFKKIYQKRY